MRSLHIVNVLLMGVYVLGAPSGSAGDDSEPRPWQINQPPAVKGVTLGSSLQDAVHSLGSPRSESDLTRDDIQGMGDLKNLDYEGLSLELCRPPGKEKYHVWRLELTSGAWVMSPGISIGMSRADVVSVLGSPERSQTKGEVETLHWSFHSIDGWLWTEISDGKLAKLGMAEDWT